MFSRNGLYVLQNYFIFSSGSVCSSSIAVITVESVVLVWWPHGYRVRTRLENP